MTERRALLVGIDAYEKAPPLAGAVADAAAMAKLLARHADGKPNFACRLLAGAMEDGSPIVRKVLRETLRWVFEPSFKGDVLVYFSGHGVLTPYGGHLVPADGEPNDEGIPMHEVMSYAAKSRASNVLFILDCCFSGDMGNAPGQGAGGDPLATLREDVTVMAASQRLQPALERGGQGVFTASVLAALEGGAADHLGWITAPAIHAYVERRFSPLDQRPVYKSYATQSFVVRECQPIIERLALQRLVDLFPSEDHRYPLDPEHEPEDAEGNVKEPVNQEKVRIAAWFKEYRDAGLLKPSTPGEQLYWTARRGHTVELTPRGREYWRLVRAGRI